MLSRRNVLSLAAVLASQLVPGAAAAQNPPADQPAAPAAEEKKSVVEEIVVTGTRIRRKDLNTTAPVTVISREQIQASGKTNVGDFLYTLPEVGSNLNAQINNAGTGSTNIDLRNLGAARTLVLVNGRRFVAGGRGADSFVDVNAIPSAVVEKIEILKDGASAVYGSDAIAGVVNIITRKSYQGVEVSAYAGGSVQHNDAGSYDFSATTGQSTEKGNVLFSIGFSRQDPVWMGNRNWSRYALAYDNNTGEVFHLGSSRIPNGRIYSITSIPDGCGDAISAANVDSLGRPVITAVPCTAGTPGDLYNTQVTNSLGAYDPTAPAGGAITPTAPGSATWRAYTNADSYNYQPANYLFTPSQRIQLWSSGDHRFGDSARAYYEASYVNRQSDQKLAPEPLIVGQDGSQNVSISAASMYNPFGRPFNLTGNALVGGGACAPYQNPRSLSPTDSATWVVNNPTGGGTTTYPTFQDAVNALVALDQGVFAACPWAANAGAVSRRLVEFSNRQTHQDLDTFRVVTGLDGSFDLGPLKGWSWDVAMNFGRTQGTELKSGNLNSTRLQNALGASQLVNGVPTCLDSGGNALSDGCVPLNLFGGAGTITPDMVNYLTFAGTRRGFTEQFILSAQTSGELFSLMADRPAAISIGYENRRERGANVPNPLNAADLASDGLETATKGGFITNEGFAELSLPIINHVPWAEEIEATIAGREVHYSSFGNNFSYKLGARYSPVRDFTLRGTYSTAFRAPNITDLYFGTVDSFEPADDPCAAPVNATQTAACGAAANVATNAGQVKARIGGNTDLTPEKAKIFTVGVVAQPRMVPSLSVTVDYYNIKSENSITTLGAGTILSSCYPTVPGLAPTLCNLVHRDTSGNISSITDTTTNVGSDHVGGIDFGVRYALPTSFGRWGLAFDGSYLLQWDREVVKGWIIKAKGTYDLANQLASATGGGLPVFKGIAAVSWAMQNFGAGVSMHYVSGFKECMLSDGTADGQSGGGICTPPPGGEVPQHRNVPAYTSFDGFVSYDLASSYGRTSLAVGMTNIFDKDPPYVYSGFTASSDPGLYNYMGRFVYARLTQKF